MRDLPMISGVPVFDGLASTDRKDMRQGGCAPHYINRARRAEIGAALTKTLEFIIGPRSEREHLGGPQAVGPAV